ncbi:MAG: hypothetical protein RIK87_23115 [Fuerstiella sp.]
MPVHHSARTLCALGLIVAVSAGTASAQQTGLAAAPAGAPVVANNGPVRSALQPVNSDHLRTSQVLGIPTSHCGHVIDLLMHNRMRQQFGQPQIDGSDFHAPHLSTGIRLGDLELLCVHLVSPGDPHQGPIFQVSMRNNSEIPIGNFRISLVAVLGQIHVHSPTATTCVPRMEVGEETQIQVQLPVDCLTLGRQGQTAEFDTLIVAIDSFDELLECDELNNVQILTRSEIPRLVATPAPVVTDGPPAQQAPSPQAPAEGPAEVPATIAPTVPDKKESSPLEGIDLDSLGLDNTQSSALFVR